MSKQLATLQYDIETGVDLAAAMGSEPDAAPCASSCASSSCGRCWSGSKRRCPRARRCPAAGSRPSSRSRPRGHAGRPRRGAGRAGDRRRPLGGGRRGAASSPAPASARRARGGARRPRLVAHDAKSLGGGRHGLLAAAAARGVELALDHDTMLAAYLLEPQRRTYELTELAADAGIGLAEGRRGAAGDERRGRTASSRSARRARPGSTRPRRRAWSRPWPTPSARASRSSGSSRCCARSSCRWSTCSPRWSARG